jgi:hypothetical protein
MDESLVNRLERAERSARFWKRTSLLLAAGLLSGLVSGVVMYHQNVEAMRNGAFAELEAEAKKLRAMVALMDAQGRRVDQEFRLERERIMRQLEKDVAILLAEPAERGKKDAKERNDQ